MTPDLDARVDRFVRGELTAAETRELAQASLEDPELFDELTNCALAKAAVADSVRTIPMTARSSRRIWIIGAAAAVAIALSLYSLRSFGPRTSTLPAALASDAKAEQPLLLARDLQPAARSDVFRAVEAESRAPQSAGTVVSMNDGVAAIDLGSLDGVARGTVLEVVRGDRPVSRLEVTGVFRESSRARATEGRAHRGDSVRIPAPSFFGALLQQVDALAVAGDSSKAHAMAEKAVEWAQANRISPADAFERLGALEYRSGQVDAAERHYQAAVDANGSPVALNALGVLNVLRGDSQHAAGLFTRALSGAKSAEYASIANNLGVLAEMGGERGNAEAHYTDALRALSVIPGFDEDRRAIESNLARIKHSR